MFGPGDLLWEMYGDRLGYLLAPRSGILQLMYPDLGRGVEQHSNFYDEPWARLFRSVPQIVDTIYGGPRAASVAAKVRDYHRDIKGEHEDGTRYHALDPDTYFWAHATFIEVLLKSSELFAARPLDVVEKRAMYAEGVRWWQMYGLSMRPVPPTYEDFVVYFDHVVENKLAATVAATSFVDMFKQPASLTQPWIPDVVWRAAAPAGLRPYRWFAVGTMPPSVRETFGFSWGRADQAAFDAACLTIGSTWRFVPGPIKLLGPARRAYAVRGRVGVDQARRKVREAGGGYLPPTPIAKDTADARTKSGHAAGPVSARRGAHAADAPGLAG